ncbi:hypothetical protein TNCV_3409331 [Trichonephila clavipes]|nr:hypothetical protein TNCV_3409331 [Trichonephila clavipes]
MLKVGAWGRRVMSSILVPLKTHLAEGTRYTLNVLRIKRSPVNGSVEVDRGVSAHVSFSSLNHGSKALE